MAKVDETGLPIPEKGQWPVEPQDDVPIDPQRIWVDGCFDFTHHGHAGAMLQARRLGRELLVGIHSDEAIKTNKGPTVMNLAERVAAVDACRWSTKSIPHAPYVTSLAWISHYGCKDVVHGDDITSDAGGEDSYRFVKDAGRFVVVRRTPGISTTDLVGRMLLCTKNHFIRSLDNVFDGLEGPGTSEERKAVGSDLRQRMAEYASDETGLSPGVQIWSWDEKRSPKYSSMVDAPGPLPDQRLVYVDGGFDLFSPGHIAFLKEVVDEEQSLADAAGWSKPYSSAYIVVGVHDDAVLNKVKGYNYPIMNVYERGLCVLQCRYVNSVIFGTPYIPDKVFLSSSPWRPEGGNKLGFDAVYHGPAGKDQPYADAKALGIFHRAKEHAFQEVNALTIVDRIMANKTEYEERQRRKGEKATIEELEKARQAGQACQA